jgi:hypothetical protein
MEYQVGDKEWKAPLFCNNGKIFYLSEVYFIISVILGEKKITD